MSTDCSHNWIGNRGSNDKPCIYCFKYPVLHLRYKCDLCHKEACVFCLKNLNIPLTPILKQQISDKPKHDTIELRILHIENILQELQERLSSIELKLKKWIG